MEKKDSSYILSVFTQEQNVKNMANEMILLRTGTFFRAEVHLCTIVWFPPTDAAPCACNCTGISTNENAFLLQLCFPSPTQRELHSTSATVRHFIRLLSDVYFSCSLLIYENVGELSFRNASAFSREGTKNLYWATINGFLMQNWMKFFFHSVAISDFINAECLYA